MAQDDATKSVTITDVEPKLRSELKIFEPYIGTWVLSNNLKDGRPFWAKSQYAVGVNGNFVVEKMFVKNEDGKVHQRHHAIWRWDKTNGMIVSHLYKHDGTYEVLKPTVKTSGDEEPVIATISAHPNSPVSTSTDHATN